MAPAVFAEVVADEAHVALGAERAALAVEGDDAAGFLSAMLQGVEAEGGQDGGVLASEDAEHAALVSHPVLRAGTEIVVSSPGSSNVSGLAKLASRQMLLARSCAAGGGLAVPVKNSMTPGQAAADPAGGAVQIGIGLALGNLSAALRRAGRPDASAGRSRIAARTPRATPKPAPAIRSSAPISGEEWISLDSRPPRKAASA